LAYNFFSAYGELHPVDPCLQPNSGSKLILIFLF